MQRLMLLVITTLTLLLASSAYAASAKEISKSSASPAAVTSLGVVAVKKFDPDQATQEWLSTLSPEARAKSDAYFEGGYWLTLWDLVVTLVVAWLLLGTGLSRRLRDFNERLIGVRFLQTALYAVEYVAFTSVVSLPWTIYENWFREKQYGMANQDLMGFLGDWFVFFCVFLVIGVIVAPVLYAIVRRMPRTWWIWGSVASIVFSIILVAIGPPVLEPLQNKFYPLKESPLKERVLSMARANGIPATDVYEFDASKQTKRMSAHVSGIGGTTRISMNDNLINRGSPEEVQAVLGHEMGHYVLHHVFHGLVEGSVLVVFGFAFVMWSFDWVRLRWGAGWGIRGIDDVAGLPLAIALVLVLFFLLTPVTNTLTRLQEAEADAFGMNAARQPDGFAQAAIHLAEYRKMEPGKWEEIFFYDHPSGYHRIHRAMVWKAEHLNDADIAAYDAAHPTIMMPDATPTPSK